METELDFLINRFFKKLKMHKPQKLKIKKEEFRNFIFFLLNNN